MNKLVPRLLNFFLGIPLALLFVFFEPFNHIALNILAAACSTVAAHETFRMLKTRIPVRHRAGVIAASAALPLFAYVIGLFGLDEAFITGAFVLVMLALCSAEILSGSFENSIASLCGKAFTVFYCGYIITYVSRLTARPEASKLIAVFLLMVFFCDSSAWLFGILFGKGNRNVFKASPNKSAAGFFGGYAGTLLIAILANRLLPQIFGGPVIKAVIFGILVATAAIAGDLIESVIKRSAGLKDSGSVIPGRGGFLDSLDSIIVTAPVYYYCLRLLF